ncbi:MAG TPA: lytic transglycosylase domain-containing protein [Bacteroidia bacterium]|nr:lytic transglycosylase domain-containing protein [Bacteroidia bacterium]HNT81135.1 lytic transglycosylase domain-containing protein [Bacteroidia bacterium]
MRRLLILTGIVITLSLTTRIIYHHFEGQYQMEVDSTFDYSQLTFSSDLNFCGEVVPLKNEKVYDQFYSILKKIVRENRRSIQLHKRSYLWFTVIDPILERHEIPEDLKYLAIVESKFLEGSSHKGASGFWQFMPATAEHLGLTVNENIDERLNVEKSTIAACRYLKFLKKRTGSWTLAAAAFNIGPERLMRKLNEQNMESYYGLKLNRETATYLFKVMAYKEMLEHPDKYGFRIKPGKVNYIPWKTGKWNCPVSLQDIAQEVNVGTQEIKEYNPWIINEDQFCVEDYVVLKLPKSPKKQLQLQEKSL